MDDWTPPALAALLIAGIVSEVGDALQFIAVVTAATSLTARYAAVLLGESKRQIERYMALGFLIGLLLSGALYLTDALL